MRRCGGFCRNHTLFSDLHPSHVDFLDGVHTEKEFMACQDLRPDRANVDASYPEHGSERSCKLVRGVQQGLYGAVLFLLAENASRQAGHGLGSHALTYEVLDKD